MGEKSTTEATASLQSSTVDPPFNERQLAWLTTVQSSSKS